MATSTAITKDQLGLIANDNDKGCWVSIWVEDVDSIHQTCLEQNIEITMPPANMPWNVRELHIRHPDGHVFRISHGIECEQNDGGKAG